MNMESNSIFVLFSEYTCTQFPDLPQGMYISMEGKRDYIVACNGLRTVQFAEFIMDMRDGKLIKCRCERGSPEFMRLIYEAWNNPNGYAFHISPTFNWSKTE